MFIAYAGSLDMKINKILSVQLWLNILYDEHQIKKIQLKETLGIGLTYNS